MGPYKKINKAITAGKRLVRKRYNIGKKKKGGINMMQVAKDAAMLVKTLNAEKKIWTITAGNTLANAVGVGQVNVNNTGSQVFDISPLVLQNVTATGRTGDSIKFTSAYFQFMVAQQAFATIRNTLSIELWHYNGGSVIGQNDFLTHLYKPTVFSGVIDFQSPRNEDYMGDFRLIRRKRVVLDPDSVNSAKTVRYINIPVSFNRGKGHHVRYTGSDITNNPLVDIANGRSQLFLIYRCESGNRNATVSTANVPITTGSSGMEVSASYTMYYYDN